MLFLSYFCVSSTILPRSLPFSETAETGDGCTRDTETIYNHKINVREGPQLVLRVLTCDVEAMGDADDTACG
jgi:hypothetical protein